MSFISGLFAGISISSFIWWIIFRHISEKAYVEASTRLMKWQTLEQKINEMKKNKKETKND